MGKKRLTLPRSEAQAKILGQIQEGRRLLHELAESDANLTELEAEASQWDAINELILTQLLDPADEVLEQYDRSRRPFRRVRTTVRSPVPPPPTTVTRELDHALRSRVDCLGRILELLAFAEEPQLAAPALHTAPGPALTTPWQQGRSSKRIPFLSISFREEDRDINDYIKGILEALEIDYNSGERYSTESIPDKVRGRILGSDLLIGVFVKRGKVKGGGYSTPSWLVREATIALEAGKDVIPLVEKGITDIAGLNLQKEAIPFERANAAAMQTATVRFLESLNDCVLAPAAGMLSLPKPVGGVKLVRIGGGWFTMGSDEDEPDERPPHEVFVEEFYLAKYPITNSEYGVFVSATDHPPPDHWKGNAYPKPLGLHPVVHVSWHDALAYCRWMSAQSGMQIRLPSEAEWEKAASWEAERATKLMYPWGDEFDESRCGTEASKTRKTTPVGKYSPRGDSPYGVGDTAGNVWEWTSTLLDKYPYNAGDGREDPTREGPRVVRGGQFGSGHREVRCAHRSWIDPSHSDHTIGFRIAASPTRRG